MAQSDGNRLRIANETEGTSALRIVAAPTAEPDPLATWSAAMPRELHTLGPPSARMLAAYLWALAGWQPGTLVRTTQSALAEYLALPASTLRDHLALLQRAGYIARLSVSAGPAEFGGGAELVVHGPAVLAQRVRVTVAADAAQQRFPAADADELVGRCRAAAAEIDAALRDGRDAPHSTYYWLIVAGAMLACGVPLPIYRAAGQPYGPITIAWDDVLSAARDAGRRGEGSGGRGVGVAYYARLRERLTVAAGERVRWPAQRDVRAACARIGWAWRGTWHQSPRDLYTAWRAATADGDSRDYIQWCAARDDELARRAAET